LNPEQFEKWNANKLDRKNKMKAKMEEKRK
jgi:hypothetical protein